MFDVDMLLADLVEVPAQSDPRGAAKELLTRALATPDDVAAVLTPSAGGITFLHHTSALTVINVAWAPHMRLMPHNHNMWALIGIYAGVEDNEFFRRGAHGELVDAPTRRIETGEIVALGSEMIHAVTNPTERLTGAIHVYGGDFVNEPRSQWGPGDLQERPYDMAEANRQFEAANVAAGLTPGP